MKQATVIGLFEDEVVYRGVSNIDVGRAGQLTIVLETKDIFVYAPNNWDFVKVTEVLE